MTAGGRDYCSLYLYVYISITLIIKRKRKLKRRSGGKGAELRQKPENFAVGERGWVSTAPWIIDMTLLGLWLARSSRQPWMFAHTSSLFIILVEVAYSRCICFMWVIWKGETTEETEPQRSRGQIGVGWLQDAVRRAARRAGAAFLWNRFCPPPPWHCPHHSLLRNPR